MAFYLTVLAKPNESQKFYRIYTHTKLKKKSLPTLADIATVKNALKMIVNAINLEDKFFV